MAASRDKSLLAVLVFHHQGRGSGRGRRRYLGGAPLGALLRAHLDPEVGQRDLGQELP